MPEHGTQFRLKGARREHLTALQGGLRGRFNGATPGERILLFVRVKTVDLDIWKAKFGVDHFAERLT